MEVVGKAIDKRWKKKKHGEMLTQTFAMLFPLNVQLGVIKVFGL